MDRSRVAIVIPAHNERDTIGGVVREVLAYGTPIVVDDASQDETAALSRDAGAIVVSNPVNGGYDAAINLGFRRAAELGADYVVTFDGDGQHESTAIAAALNELERGADIVVGRRPRTYRVSERLFAAVTRHRYGIADPLCGLKAYRMSLYQARGRFDVHRSIGTELMLYGVRRGFRLSQIDVRIRERNGHSRFGHAFGVNLKILRAMLNMMRE